MKCKQTIARALLLGVLSAAGCRHPIVSLEDKACDGAGRCAPGYTCDAPSGRCVKELTGTEGQTGTEGTTGTGSGTGTTGETGSTGNTGSTGSTGATGDPRVTTLTVTSGEHLSTTYAFTKPSGAIACVVRRATGALPTSASDGSAVGSETASDSVLLQDIAVANGTTYGYASFCRSGDAYQTVTVTAGENGAFATPIAIVQDLMVSMTGTPSAVITYTKPPGASACKIKRGTGSTPSPTTGTDIGVEQTGATGGATDSSVSLGQTYEYAVFCRADADYRNSGTQTGKNLQSVTFPPPVCNGTFTVTRFSPGNGDAKDCLPFVGDTQVVLLRLTATSATCRSHLRSIIIRRNTLSTTNFSIFRLTTDSTDPANAIDAGLAVDGDGDGAVIDAEKLTGTAIRNTNDAITITLGTDFQIPLGQSRDFLVWGRLSPTPAGGYLEARIAGTSDFTVVEGTMTKVLSPNPLDGDAHGVTPVHCSGPSASTGLPVATDGMLKIDEVRSISNSKGPSNTIDFTSVDPVASCVAADRCDLTGASTSNCNVDDNAVADQVALQLATDNDSRFLRIDTGIPFGLDVCAVSLTLFSTQSTPDATTCDTNGELFLGSALEVDEHYIYRYDTTAVGGSPLHYHVANGSPLSASPGDGCNYMSVTHDISSLYKPGPPASGTTPSTLILRVFADTDTDSTNNSAYEVLHVPEIYVRIHVP
ncbi:MAG: hypothetical protein IT381_09880 [Deltaproteobacteria bacterium]|nr:hypothetical protein [Deltaproteobacteria bacterium]